MFELLVNPDKEKISTEECTLDCVLDLEESHSIRKLFGKVGREEPKSKTIGKTGNCPYLNCPFLFSFGYETYCDNSEVIRIFLEKDNGNPNDYQ